MRFYPAITLTWTQPTAEDASDLLLARLDGTGVTAVEDLADGIRVFFSKTEDRDAALESVSDLAWVRRELVDVPDGDWAARSQASIGAVTVERITIAPPWTVTPELREATPHLIVIQPSMGFGTGHHASTRLCLHWLQTLALADASVLDVGTGSGVLAIAAHRLGAALTVGIDVDPDALANAHENVELNDATAGVELHELDLSTAVAALGQRFDVVLANLTGGLLCRDAGVFLELAAPDARLIISGFQTHETAQVAGAFQDAGWTLIGKTEEGTWVGALWRRTITTKQ